MNRFVRCSLSAAAGMALVTWAGAAALAQNPASQPQQTQQSPAAQTSPTTQSPTPQAQAPAPQSQAGATEAQPQPSQQKIELVKAQAELNTSLDAKKAKQGEPVKAKLTGDVQIPDGQPLPKNTVLEGHVDQVTASDHKKGDSTVVVTFDKAKLKNGQELSIKATVLAVAEPVMAMEQGGGAAAGGGMPAASGGGMPSGGGGGMQGGGGGGSHASGGSASGGGAAGPQQPTMPDAAASTSQQGSGGVPDVKLTSDIHQRTSATFTSTGKNVHVPGGTEMEMAIAVIPAGVHLQ